MQGKVDRIWRNQRADGSEYWVLAIDGRRYAAWERELAEGVKEGDFVDFEFSHSGRYRNLTAIALAPGTAFTRADRMTPSPGAVRVARMKCIRAAAEMLRDNPLPPDQKPSLVLAIAEKFARYVLAEAAGTAQGEPQRPETGTKAPNQEPAAGAG